MKVKMCHCRQCMLSRADNNCRRRNRIQTYYIRSKKSKVREMLKEVDFYNADIIEDSLPIQCSLPYYA